MNRALLKHFTSLLMFGSNGIIASNIHLNSYIIVMFRTIIGSLFLIAVCLFTCKEYTFLKHKRSLLYLTLSGISMGFSWMFLYEAYHQIGVSIATLLYYTGPIFIMLLSPYIFNEKLTLQKVACFMTVLLGILLINYQAAQESHTTWGLLCSLLSAVTYASMVIFNKKSAPISGIENSTIQLITAFFTVFAFVLYTGGLNFVLAPSDILPLALLGLVNTGFGCYLYFSSISGIPVQMVSILGYTEPLSALIFSYIFLNEQLAPIQIAGAVLIICGTIAAQKS